MRLVLIFVGFIFFSSLIGQNDVLHEKVDHALILQKELDQDVLDGQFAGAVVGMTIGDEEIVAVSGFRNVKAKIPFERHTLTRIASISKSMTAIAALQLYERGDLDLDEPISSYLPEYPKKNADRITTRHLLQHSSGIPGYKSGSEKESKVEYSSLASAAAVFQDRELVDEPGNAEHYTTYGYVVLGMVIEAVSGQSYADYMQEYIWDVVGMEQTGIEDVNKNYKNKSEFYQRTKRGKVKESKINNLSNRIPGGGIYSTIDDLLKFGRAVLDHRLINEDTFSMMMEEPGLAYDGNPYGMGWYLYGENPDLGQVYGHGGGQTGCSSILFIMPESDAVAVVLSNTSRTFSHVFGIAFKKFPLIKEIANKQ